ncbi:MAG: NAD(+)/NADH kinase [Methylophilaceae bacterium]|nr:NAD(+)/NADH kinase [Methylophilaceae bacterium]
MQRFFHSVAIVGKYIQEHTHDEVLRLARHLKSKGLTVYLEERTATHLDLAEFPALALQDMGAQTDLVIVLGGDGTMLGVARGIGEVPLVGINLGRRGFLTDLRTDDMYSALEQILEGHCSEEARFLLTVAVQRGERTIYSSQSFNDVVIKSGLRLIEMVVHIDQELVHKQRSDGLIIATPTGTTAYALSAGGPILHPSVEAILLAPVCPHTLSNRPIVVNSNSHISVSLLQSDEANLSVDGQFVSKLVVGDVIQVWRSSHKVILLHPKHYCYFEMLRSKLNWG